MRYSVAPCRTCNRIERSFNHFRHFRRVLTRDDKLADSYLIFVSLACTFGMLVKMRTAPDDTVRRHLVPGIRQQQDFGMTCI
ncbi:transposase [Paraburkholderia madseniana]|uniref:Transposase n=1 Tax=Paraburkholderia madseniana TaxID=2599607 RepID=A0A6N6W3U5_9BURK|nr:transposase [Paraburkholderia madseniana]